MARADYRPARKHACKILVYSDRQNAHRLDQFLLPGPAFWTGCLAGNSCRYPCCHRGHHGPNHFKHFIMGFVIIPAPGPPGSRRFYHLLKRRYPKRERPGQSYSPPGRRRCGRCSLCRLPGAGVGFKRSFFCVDHTRSRNILRERSNGTCTCISFRDISPHGPGLQYLYRRRAQFLCRHPSPGSTFPALIRTRH